MERFTLGSGELPERDDNEGQEDRRAQEDRYNDGCDGTRSKHTCTHREDGGAFKGLKIG